MVSVGHTLQTVSDERPYRCSNYKLLQTQESVKTLIQLVVNLIFLCSVFTVPSFPLLR